MYDAAKVYSEREIRQGKLDVFWHTQGPGKSYSMMFLAEKIMRKFSGCPTQLVLTNRKKLDVQISKTLEICARLADGPAVLEYDNLTSRTFGGSNPSTTSTEPWRAARRCRSSTRTGPTS